MAKGKNKKQVSPQVKKASVLKSEPIPADGAAPMTSVEASVLWFVARALEEIVPWGRSPKTRDQQLRQFLLQESYCLSALGTVVARNVGFDWNLQGPPRVVSRIQDVLQNTNQGKGWDDFIAKLSLDFYSQDSGAFMEICRAGKSPDAALIGLNHLDAARCYPTGNDEFPVIYRDKDEVFHKLAWYQVVQLLEMPAPLERPPGLQYCAMTRLLRAAQVIRNITLYKEEKTGGRHSRALHLIKGISTEQIQDAVATLAANADSQGLLRFVEPLLVGSPDPKADIDVKTLELASLPDGFDEEKTFKQYITIIAMAFLSDYQDFSPLPGGNLGTSAQSEVLHMKTRGKGPALFRKKMAHVLNFHVLPRAVTFEYEEQDLAAEKDEADIQRTRAETRKFQIESGELTPEAARQVAVDLGDIPQEVFEALGGVDVTPEVTAPDDERSPQGEAEKEVPAKAGPFRRRMGGGVHEDGAEGEEGAVAYW